LIDKNNSVLRPCILWNDTRSTSQCVEMEKNFPLFREQSGNIPMPGFTAPKILWVQKHEPDIFKQIHKVLLPKDYLRFKLTGSYYTDMSDASGTLWLDVKKRKWSEDLLNLTNLNLEHMPKLVEGSDPTDNLSLQLKEELSFDNNIIIAGGAGDQAAGAIGSGVIDSHQSMISLGTSGVYFSPTSKFSSNTNQAVHSFCHCLPDTWHHMSVMLSATNCLNWIAHLYGLETIDAINKAKIFFNKNFNPNSTPFFLPYLSGERTPHNNPYLRGSFHMLTTSTSIDSMLYAVIEGISFGIKDGFEAVHSVSSKSEDIYIIGGGSKSFFWADLIASVLDQRIIVGEDSDLGPAVGVARLAMLATKKYKKSDVVKNMQILHECLPSNKLSDQLQNRYHVWKEIVSVNKPIAKIIMDEKYE
jgi:xylulokinase